MRCLAALFYLILTSLASAQEWNLFSPCRDVGLSPREIQIREAFDQCNPAELLSLHAQFGAPPIRDLAGPAGRAVRVTVTDGYGKRVVLIETVLRADATTPRVIVRGKGDGDRRAREVMEADLDPDGWESIARRATERAIAPALLPVPEWRDPATHPEEAQVICLHGWSVVIETFGFGQPRVLARNSCDRADDVKTYELGWRVVRHAFAAFPACSWLDRQFYRNDASRLEFCLGLSGEAHVAASATNAARPFVFDVFVNDRLRYLLADDFTLTLPGEVSVTGAELALARWRAFVAAGDYDMSFDVARGAIGDRWEESARITLILFDDAWRRPDESRFSEVVQTWLLDDNQMWLLTSMEVGPFQRIRIQDEN